MIEEEEENRPQERDLKVMAAMLFAVLALAFSSIFITYLERAQVPPIAIAFYRMAIATALLLPAALALRRREMSLLTRRELALLLLAGFCLAVHFGAYITSLKYIPIATSVVLVNSHPLFVVLASYVFLGERPSRIHLIGTVTGLAGMLIIGREGLKNVELALVGDALAILGALSVVGYFIVGRKVRARISLLGYVTPLYAVCSAFLLVWAVASGTRLYPYGPSEWLYFAALAVVPTILGHTVFNWAIKHVRPSTISLAFLGEPVVASVLAFFFFDQSPPLSTFVGGAVVLLGVYLTTAFGAPAPPPRGAGLEAEPHAIIYTAGEGGRDGGREDGP
ncbi:MAG TPA: DMT family transporter [Blastocatellia bacterium]|nr:DMT family transporter [Blastocatellia bacterium]